MLNSILPYVVRYSNVIATVTGIDVEVVDHTLLRIAGTGMYAEGVGSSIHEAGEVYRHVLNRREAVFMDNPREHALCRTCTSRPSCREMLSLCTPIIYEDTVLGVIGLVCFTETERERVLSHKYVFLDFVRQIADAISKEVQEEQKLSKTRQWLDMLLQIVDGNSRGIVVLDVEGRISYMNDMAERQLGLPEGQPLQSISLRQTGDSLSGMEEYEVQAGDDTHVIMGHVTPLDSKDPAFAQVLVFESLPHLAKLLSQAVGATEGTGGLQSIIGQSRLMRVLKAKVLQIARTSSTVLITGASGTGKEMFARAIHAESDRRDKPFIAINCGAIPDALLESELFGYVRGAFTGAAPSGRMGKFELAHQGVLFLDEIGAMPLYLQVKLLRALQEKRIMRLGSNRLVDVDVRIIAATNDNLQELISQRMFRDDLYYRLNVVPLEIPPLRLRSEDIPDFAAAFLDRYCRRFGKRPLRLSAGVMEALTAYHWPGNVREFENIMEYLVNISPDGAQVGPSMLPAKIRETVATARAKQKTEAVMNRESPPGNPAQAGAPAAHHIMMGERAEQETAEVTPGAAPIVSLETLERQALQNALARFGSTAEGKRKAAEALGIGVATLYRKLKAAE